MEEPNKRNIADMVFDWLPEWARDRIYDRAVRSEYARMNSDEPERSTIITRSVWFGDAAATAAQALDAEAASVWDDRRKYNLEHGLPLTAEQQQQQAEIAADLLPVGANDGVHLLRTPLDIDAIMRGLMKDVGLVPLNEWVRQPHLVVDNSAAKNADLDRVEHEQGTTAENWSGDRDAELERLELDQETHGERGRSEPPERGIEDDELER